MQIKCTNSRVFAHEVHNKLNLGAIQIPLSFVLKSDLKFFVQSPPSALHNSVGYWVNISFKPSRISSWLSKEETSGRVRRKLLIRLLRYYRLTRQFRPFNESRDGIVSLLPVPQLREPPMDVCPKHSRLATAPRFFVISSIIAEASGVYPKCVHLTAWKRSILAS